MREQKIYCDECNSEIEFPVTDEKFFNKEFCDYECMYKHAKKKGKDEKIELIEDLKKIRFNAAGELELKNLIEQLEDQDE